MKVSDLRKYKSGLYASLSRDLSDFEKNFLLISAGTFTISVTFIKDIVKLDTAVWLNLLFLGWGLIGIATGILMFAFLYSVDSSNKLWKCVDDYLITNNKYNDEEDLSIIEAQAIKTATNTILYGSKKKLRTLRGLAVISFLVGIASLSLFIGKNITESQRKIEPKVIKSENSVFLNLNDYNIFKNDSILIVNQKERKYVVGKKRKCRTAKKARTSH